MNAFLWVPFVLLLGAVQEGPPPADEVHLVDGRVLTGEVIDEGVQIRLVKDLGSILIPKRDIVKVEIGDGRPARGATLDRVILYSGTEITGKVRLEDGGNVVVVLGEFGQIKHPRSGVREIVYASPDGDGSGEGGLRGRCEELLEGLADPEGEGKAREEILALGVYAIPHLEDLLATADGDRRERIQHLLRVNRLRTVLTVGIEMSLPTISDRLLDPDAKVRFEALQEIVLFHVDDSVPILLHVVDEGEVDAQIRGYVVGQLGKMARNAELIRLLQVEDPQVQLASAIALGENGILLGVPVLIQALSVEDETVRSSVSGKLKQFSGEDFLYWPNDPEGDPEDPAHQEALQQARRERAEAIARWEKWWEEKGDGLIRLSMKEFKKGIVTPEEREEAERFFSQGSDVLDRISQPGTEVTAEEIHRGVFMLRSALEKDPGLGKARLHLAILHYLRGERSDLVEATSQLGAITQRYAKESGPRVLKLAHYYLGRISSDGGKWEEARVHFEDAVRVDPDFVDGYLSLGQASFHRVVFQEEMDNDLKKRLLEASVRRFGEAIDASKRNYNSLVDASKELSLIQGQVPFRGGAFKTHLRDYGAVLRTKSARVHFWKGRAYLALGEEEKALSEFKDASRLDPKETSYRQAADLLGPPLDPPPSEK